MVTVPLPVSVVCNLTPHAIPTETELDVSYVSSNVGGDVTIVQEPVPEVVNVLEPLPEKPQNTIIQFETGGVILADVQIDVTPLI
jgi:hypothetical protein